MLTAGVVIRTLSGRAAEVEHELSVVPGMRVLTREGTSLTAVCSVPDGESLPQVLDRLAAEHRDIVRIQTTFVRT